MDNILFKLQAFESKNVTYDNLHKNLGCDRRSFANDLLKFTNINRKMLDFLGVRLSIDEENYKVHLDSDRYIGSISTKLPKNGLQGGDIQVYPRFFNSNKISDLCKLLLLLSDSIEPEIITEEMPLKNAEQMSMPLYHDACKYIDLFAESLRVAWRKFDKNKNNSNYPKSSTDWNKYAKQSFDVNQRLKYPVNDSILTSNHEEYQQLKFIFESCSKIILNEKTPINIRYQYQNIIDRLGFLSYNLKSRYTDKIKIHMSDPPIIKKLKDQGNIIIDKKSSKNYSWRIDCSILFEKYVQYILKLVSKEIGISSENNVHFNGSGGPSWVLKYLEPDIIINYNDLTIIGDAKYKPYFINEIHENDFKDEFRSDLHQLLAYCSFVKSKNKIGIFFCPSVSSFEIKEIKYHYNKTSVINTVLIVCMPFGVNEIEINKNSLKELFNKYFHNQES